MRNNGLIFYLICQIYQWSTPAMAKFNPVDASSIDREELLGTETYNDKVSYRYPNHWRKKERIGWVCVINHQAGAFTERDDQLLDMIASKISSVCNRLSLMQQKRAADRLGIVGQLVSSVVHDIRNPMSTISGFSQLITASPDMDHDELTGFFRIIDSEILRCNNMLDELLDFAAGKSNLKLRKVQLQEFLDSINLSLSHQAERKGIGFEIYCEKDGDILMDPDRVMRVVFNIANNAFEVLGRGGSFRVDCSWQPDGLVEGHDDLH